MKVFRSDPIKVLRMEAAKILQSFCVAVNCLDDPSIVANLHAIEHEFLNIMCSKPTLVLIEVFRAPNSVGRNFVKRLVQVLLTKAHTNQIYRILSILLQYHEFRGYLQQDNRLACFLLQRFLARDPDVPLDLALLIPWQHYSDPALLKIFGLVFLGSDLYWYHSFSEFTAEHDQLRASLLDHFVQRLSLACGKLQLLLCFSAILRLTDGYSYRV